MAAHVPTPFLLPLLCLRPEERIPRHIQDFIFGNDLVQVTQQGEAFGFNDSASLSLLITSLELIIPSFFCQPHPFHFLTGTLKQLLPVFLL